MVEACELGCVWLYAGMVAGLAVGVSLAVVCVVLAVDTIKHW